jgi:6,7-dimethyl-8-ribityllumazine synthase
MPIERLESNARGDERRVAIVQSRFNPAIGAGLLKGALRALAEAGVVEERITLLTVPGALEIPLALQRLAQSGDYDVLVALEFGVPIGNGILTCDTDAQAEARMATKGGEAAQAALELANLLDAIDRR